MRHASQSAQRGMSLVEVLVAVAIGLIGILVIMQAYITGDKFNRSTAGAGSAQTKGTIALFSIERDVRMAGYGINNSSLLGCGQIYWYYDPQYSSNVTPGSTLPILTLAPVYIDSTVTPNTITVMYGSGGDRMVPSTIKSFNAASSEVTVDGTGGFAVNDLIVLANASGCTLAKITQVQPGPSKIQMNPGVSAPYNPPAWGSFPTTYSSNDTIVDLGNPKVRVYSVSNNTLQVQDSLLQAGGAAPVDLVDGIVDLRAQYGKDDGVPAGTTAGDGIVDEYSNTQPSSSAQWLQVLSVRIGILARVGNYEKPVGGTCAATTTAPTWSGGNFTVPEGLPSCYRYRVFETVVPLRNMIWSS